MLRTTLVRGALAAIFLTAAWACFGATSTSGHDAHPGLNFWMAVDGLPDCNTRSGEATCDITPGSTFVIDVYLDPLPSDITGYGGFDVSLLHRGVIPNQDASTGAWPDCAFPTAAYDLIPRTDVVAFGCAIGVPPAGASTYSGLIGTISFTCTQAGSIAMLHGTNNTDLVEVPDIRQVHAEDPNTTESLNITCGLALARFADANCDRLVNSIDTLLILQWNAHVFDRLPCAEAADANADGVVDPVDAALVLQAGAGLLELPPPPPISTSIPKLTVTPMFSPTP